MKNRKTFYHTHIASCLKQVIQPPHHIKSYYISGGKLSHGDIQKYTDICFQSASRRQFLRVQKWCSANVFSDAKQKHVCCKIAEVFGCVAGACYFQCQVS